MKLYVHYEPSDAEEFEYTKIMNVEGKRSFDWVILEFKKAFESYFLETTLTITGLVDVRDRKIRNLKDKMDVYIVGRHETSGTSRLEAEKMIAKKTEKKPKKGPGKAISFNLVKIRQQQEDAQRFFQLRKFRLAIDTYTDLQGNNFDELGVLRNMAFVYQRARKYDMAEKFLKLCIEKKGDEPSFREALADTYIAQKKFASAMTQLDVAERQYKVKKDLKSIGNIQVRRGMCDYGTGRRQEGFNRVRSVLQKERTNVLGLVLYARAILEFNKEEVEALRIMIQLIATTDPYAHYQKMLRERVSDILSRSNGLKILDQVLQKGDEEGDMYSFTLSVLSSVCSSSGKTKRALEIAEKAMSNSKENKWKYHNLLIDALTVESKDVRIWKMMKTLWKRNDTVILDGSWGLPSMKASDVMKVFHGRPHMKLTDWKKHMKSFHEFKKLLRWRTKGGFGFVCVIDKEEDLKSVKVIKPPKVEKKKKDDKNEGKATDNKEEIKKNGAKEFLSLMFRVVETMFQKGFWDVIPFIIELIEPWRNYFREESEHHLSKFALLQGIYTKITHIVMEHISSCQKDKNAELTLTGSPLYLVGDSSIFPFAFRSVDVCGKKRLILPVYVDVNVYDLRSDLLDNLSSRKSFFKCQEQIPFGSDVIFMLGSSDCSYALLDRYQEMVFDSVEQGIEKSAGAYVNVVNESRLTSEFKTFVCPVLPLEEDTRDIACEFNKILVKKVSKVRRIKYVDLKKVLAEESTGEVKKEFVLKEGQWGCVNNKAVEMFEKALNEAFKKP